MNPTNMLLHATVCGEGFQANGALKVFYIFMHYFDMPLQVAFGCEGS